MSTTALVEKVVLNTKYTCDIPFIFIGGGNRNNHIKPRDMLQAINTFII